MKHSLFRKALSLALCLIMVFAVMPMTAGAAAIEYTSSNFIYSIENGKATVIGSTFPSDYEGFAAIVSPLVYNNEEYQVTSIGYDSIDGNFTYLFFYGDIERIEDNAMRNSDVTKSLYISDSITYIGDKAFGNSRVAWFGVDAKNPVYYSNNGYLYKRDGTLMVAPKTEEACVIDDGTKTIKFMAFHYFSGPSVTIPASVTTIEDSAFCDMFGFIENTSIKKVYYEGTWAQWNRVNVNMEANPSINRAHLFVNDWYKYTDVDCGNDGVERRDCKCSDNCTEYELRTVATATGEHNYQLSETVAATCSETGSEVYVCSVCKAENTKTLEINPDNHVDATELRNARAATICTDGYTGDECCTGCDAVLNEGEAIPSKRIHQYTVFVERIPGNCITRTVDVYRCEGCKLTMTINADVPSEEHVGNIITVDAREATCTEKGYTGNKQCDACELIVEIGEDIPLKEHELTEWETTPPGCTYNGKNFRECVNCDYIEKEVIPATGHSYTGSIYIKKKPTCTEEGIKGTFCINCNSSVEEPIPATGVHVYGEWYVYSEPSCKNEGEKRSDCIYSDVCGAYEKEVLAKTDNHSFVLTSESAPTCTEKGVKVYTCSVCTKEKAEYSDKDASNHNGAATVLVGEKAATCVAEGYTGDEYCTACSAVVAYGEIIPATGTHVFAVLTEKQPGTCDSTGYAIYKCKSCEKTMRRNLPKNPSDHKDGRTVTVGYVEATCSEDGYTGDVRCSYCSELFTPGTVIPATHDHPDSDRNGICDNCSMDKTRNCSHLCHKSGFLGFIWKIVRFFWKLFKMNPVCECGQKHY